jgi:hypothetical protein
MLREKTQNSLLGVFGVKPKTKTKENAVVEEEDDADIQVVS